MKSAEINPCMFCPNNYAADQFEDHLYLHYHLCFRCKWCRNIHGDGFDPIFVYYGVSECFVHIITPVRQLNRNSLK